MPPSSWLTASAWESLARGLSGSAKLNAATLTGSLVVVLELGAGVVDVALGVVVVPPAPPEVDAAWAVGAFLGSGVLSLTSTTGFSPLLPLMTKTAGCFLVAPPSGIRATARCLPGFSVTGAAAICAAVWGCGRATLAGATTMCAAASSVPLSVARTGWYWPEGHQAQASSAAAATAASASAPWRSGRPPLQ